MTKYIILNVLTAILYVNAIVGQFDTIQYKDNKTLFEGKSILVTGGTGSLGSILVRELLKYNPKKVVVFSRDEHKQAAFEEILKNQTVKFVIGDVGDFNRVLYATRGIDIVIHTAALKRIDSLEYNVEEAIKTNVLGSSNVFKACIYNKVKRAVLVSTDKSCSAVSAYGASKFLSEKIFTNYSKRKVNTVFSVARFGNIMGSTGSIIPIILNKIKKNENIPLTDPRMTRFIITREKAVEVVFDALRYAEGGEIFIKKISAIKIVDLIDTLRKLYNSLSEVKVIGLRPGERLYEGLLSDEEFNRTFEFEDNYVVIPSIKEWSLNIYNSPELPVYMKKGIKLSTKLSQEPRSGDYVMSKQDLETLIGQLDLQQMMKM